MTKDDIANLIKNAIMDISPYGAELMSPEINFNNNDVYFVDLGVNSIDYAQIASFLTNELGCDIPLATFVNKTKVCDVIDLLFDYRQEKQAITCTA